MAIGICSVLGVILAFSGLAVFLVSLISLLPINIYNAIRSCLVLQKAVAISDSNLLPVLFFSGTILLALVSLGLFSIMTHKSKGKTEHQDSTYGSTTNGGNNNSNTKPSVLAKHKHRVVNIYSVSYVVIDVIWLVAGILLFHSMSNNNSDQVDEGQHYESIKQAIGSQIYVIGMNLMIIVGSFAAMCVASLFFYLDKKKSGSSKPYYNIV